MSQDLYNVAERADRALRGMEDSEIERFNQALDSSYLQLERELLRKYPQYSSQAQPNLLGTQRGVLLTQELTNLLTLINPERERELNHRYQRLLGTASKDGITLSDELIRLQAGDDFVRATATVPIEAVAVMASQAVDRLKKHDQKFREDASVILTQGLIQGWGAQRVAAQLRQQLGTTKGKAEVIARTEILNAHNQAIQQNFKANGIQYFQFTATADDRLCPTCGARNMQVYKVGESVPPIHPRCRCTAMPYMPDWEQSGEIDTEWAKQFRGKGLQEIEASGQQLDTKPTYFERSAGLLVAPAIIWAPGKGYTNKDVEKQGQNWAVGALALALLARGGQQQTQPTPQEQEQQNNDETLKTVLFWAGVVGVSALTYYTARQRYRAGFKDSARMAEEMIADLDLDLGDVPDDAEFITLVSGGFGGTNGRSGLKHAEKYGEFLRKNGHHMVGVENPNTDRAASITDDPVGHIATNWGGLVNRAIIEGRNPDAVKMAAIAAAYYRKTGKPVNLLGYSAGGFVASEAHEILKLMNVPVRTATVGTPYFGFTDLSKSEMHGFVGDGDLIGGLPVQNRVTVKDVKAHWLEDYLSSSDFEQELTAWLTDATPRTVRSPAEEDWLKREADRWAEWADSITPGGKYREGFEKSAQMAREMSKDFERMARDIRPDDVDAVSFVAGGFAGQKGQASLQYAEVFQTFMDNHLVLGTPTPEFDTDIDLKADPFRHLVESYKTIAETYLLKGRNMSAVRMAAMAYAYHKEHGKPINLVGYSGGGLVAVEAAEILKKMGVPVKVASIGSPTLGFDRLSADEHATFIGAGDMFVNFPIRNKVQIDDVQNHWLNSYIDSDTFIGEIRNFLGVRPRRDYQPPHRPVEPDFVDADLVDFVPQLQLMGEAELKRLPAPIAQKVLAARAENLKLKGIPDPKLLTGLPELLALPAVREQIAGLLRGVPQPNLLPGIPEFLALPGVKDQIKGLLEGKPDPKLLPSAAELLALPAVAEPIALLTGRLDPKLLKGIPEPLLLAGYQELLMLPGVKDQIKGLLRGELPPLQLPAGIDIKLPANQQEQMLRQTQKALYQQMRSMQRRFNRDAEKTIKAELDRIAASSIPPFAKLDAYRKLMYDQLFPVASPLTQKQPPGTANPEDMTSFEFAGIQWHTPELKPTSPALDIVRKLAALGLPDELLAAVNTIYISRQKSSVEQYWRKVLKLPAAPVPAIVNFEDASITLYRGKGKTEDILRQMGYLLAYQTWGRLNPPDGSRFANAIKEGRPITTYGFNSAAADFADSVAQFFLDPDRMRRFNPQRYETIARMLNFRHPEKPITPKSRKPDPRGTEIITGLRQQNQALYEQAQQQRQQAESIALKQRSTKKVEQALTRVKNDPELTALAQNGYSQIRVQDESLDRLEVEIQELEQRRSQLLNPLNNPYFTEVPPRLRAVNKQLKGVEKQLRQVETIANAAAKVRANAVELQQTLSDLSTRRESLKVSSEGQKIDAALTQLRSSLQQAEQDLIKLPQSPERSQALRELLRVRAVINAQTGGVTVAQLHRDALTPRIQQLSQLATDLEGLGSRLGTTRTKLTTLQTRLAQLPAKVADLTPDQQAQYGAIKRTRIAQSKLPGRVENYRTVKQQYTEKLAEQGQNTQKIADDYNGQRQAAINNVSAFVELRLDRIRDRMSVLADISPESVQWLLGRRGWESEAVPNDLAIVLANQPGRTQKEKLEAAVKEVERLVNEAYGALVAVEKRLDYPNELAQTTAAQVEADRQQWERIRNALTDEETLSDKQIKELLEDPSKIKPIDVIRYGNQLSQDLEQFQTDFVSLLLQDERTDPKTIIDQAELYRRARDAFGQEITQTRGTIASEIEQALATNSALQQRLQRDQADPLIYDIKGKARSVEDIKAELADVKAAIQQYTTIKEIKLTPQLAEYEDPTRAEGRQRELQAFEVRQQRFQELRDRLTQTNREIQKRREAAERGQTRGIATDRLEAEQRQIIDEIMKLAQEWTNDPGDNGAD